MRSSGYIVALPGITPEGGPRITFEKPRPAEWELFEKVEPFVFSSDGEGLDISTEAANTAANWREGYALADIDAPFPVFSIECLDGPLDYFTVPHEPQTRRETLCCLIIEILPKQYGYYTLTKDFNAPYDSAVAWKSNAETRTVEYYLDRLSKEKMGIENVRHVVRLGTGSQKKMHRIRKVIHVTPRKNTEHYDSTRTVDWSHRWEVRGHWVKLEINANGDSRLGKDRNGDYCVSGWTWRNHHVKGPEHLPLVKKVRVVE